MQNLGSRFLTEWVYILELRKAFQYYRQFLGKGLLRELDLSSIETPYSADLKTSPNLCRKASLCPAQNHIEELLTRRHGWDFLGRLTRFLRILRYLGTFQVVFIATDLKRASISGDVLANS